MLSSWFITW